jgi:hypothetical protein
VGSRAISPTFLSFQSAAVAVSISLDIKHSAFCLRSAFMRFKRFSHTKKETAIVSLADCFL